MSELVVAKAGGTSNRDAAAVRQSLEWAEQADIFVASAPGALDEVGQAALKITDLLLEAHCFYQNHGSVPSEITDAITGRYAEIASGVGANQLPLGWIDNIAKRVVNAVHPSKSDTASMLGERLQAEIYESLGFTMLDPAQAQFDLGNDPDLWRGWLESAFKAGKKYILPGNTTLINGQLVTFDRGGSDISGGLAAYAINASKYLNLTDGPALSADPRLFSGEEQKRLRQIPHILYQEARELGRNGTGLVHAAALVAPMRGNIPTEIRSTFDALLPVTVIDNNHHNALERSGQIIAVSLMEDVVVVNVHESGMAESVGRLAAFESALASSQIAVIDSQGDGVDGQKYFIDAAAAEQAYQILKSSSPLGAVSLKQDVSLITLVGYNAEHNLPDNIRDIAHSSGGDGKLWQTEGHDFSSSKHSLRISVDADKARTLLQQIHRHFIEQDRQ
jgi:aspartate kinase